MARLYGRCMFHYETSKVFFKIVVVLHSHQECESSKFSISSSSLRFTFHYSLVFKKYVVFLNEVLG